MCVAASPVSVWQSDRFCQNWMKSLCGFEADLPFAPLWDSAQPSPLPFTVELTWITHLAFPPLGHELLRRPGVLLNILTGSEASHGRRCSRNNPQTSRWCPANVEVGGGRHIVFPQSFARASPSQRRTPPPPQGSHRLSWDGASTSWLLRRNPG